MGTKTVGVKGGREGWGETSVNQESLAKKYNLEYFEKRHTNLKKRSNGAVIVLNSEVVKRRQPSVSKASHPDQETCSQSNQK